MNEKDVDPRVRQLASDVAEGKAARLVEEMIDTAMGFGRDSATIAELKLMNRELKEMRTAARVFSNYNRVRKVAVFGSARTTPDQDEYKVAEAFGREIVEQGYMVITGGGGRNHGGCPKGSGS